MGSGPLFSIIIPTYNAEKTLSDAIESVLNQSFKDYEILIMDGASNDDTLKIAGKYINSPLKIFSEKDAGTYDAMNKGVRAASGEWLYFLGSDDKITSGDVLEKVAPCCKGVDTFIYGNVKIHGSTTWATDGDIYDGEFDLQKMLTKNICQQAIFYKASIFKKFGDFNIKYRLCADWDLNIYCYASEKPRFMNIIVADYCGTGLSSATEDMAFVKDKMVNTILYFQNKLSKTDFEKYRLILRRLLINSDPRLTFLIRLKILIGCSILQMRIWSKRILHR